MRRKNALGLDELMIVNPGPPGPGSFFLSDDGTLYQVQGIDREEELAAAAQYFLGEGDSLYHVQGFSEGEGGGLGCFIFGGDGTLYEVVR